MLLKFQIAFVFEYEDLNHIERLQKSVMSEGQFFHELNNRYNMCNSAKNDLPMIKFTQYGVFCGTMIASVEKLWYMFYTFLTKNSIIVHFSCKISLEWIDAHLSRHINVIPHLRTDGNHIWKRWETLGRIACFGRGKLILLLAR